MRTSVPAWTSTRYWITSSARPSSNGGIVRPSVLAVLRLMTSSNFVGCSMGRSLGTLTPYPPASNGGVHRGPDKSIRRNVVRAIFMGALTDEGVSLEPIS